MTYHYVTTGKPDALKYAIIWKGNIKTPIATCADSRNASKICDALNRTAGGPPAPPAPPASAEWISVSNDMPDDEELVLIRTTDENFYLGVHLDDGWWDDDAYPIRAEVTHWSHLIGPNQ